ncbi:hypothetical protein [Methylobacterium brachiatum]|uniref:hypothetical protein n=1 Tax=Methylobacterium brachiatum TaxID=269660 RepID=UPI0011136F48|nr:hypothetical protein [Methylobacterium brachiatum]
MNTEQLSKEEARIIAENHARDNLKHLINLHTGELFEDFVIERKTFWLFFRNRKIILSPPPNQGFSDDMAYAVGKRGLFMLVADNLDDSEKLAEQVDGLEGYFERRGQ